MASSNIQHIQKYLENHKPTGIRRRREVEANTNVVTRFLFSTAYNGEKTMGELGPIEDYGIDHRMLRQRSWDAYLTNEIVQIIINRFSTWVIGKGLKLQCEPNKAI